MTHNNQDSRIPIIGNQREAITLRFSKHDLALFTDIIEFTQGHRDLKQGLRNIVVTVMHTALENLKKKAAEQAAELERIKSEQKAGTVNRDSEEASVSTSSDSTEVSAGASVEAASEGTTEGQ